MKRHAEHKIIARLKSLEVPLPREEVRDRHLEYARYAFQSSTADEYHRIPRVWWFSRFTVPTSVVALAVLCVVALRLGNPGESGQVLIAGQGQNADANLLQQVASLFPGQLRAIISNGGSPQLVLGEARAFSGAQPLVVDFEGRDHRYRVITYSGETIELPLKEGVQRFEVLVSADGKVLIVGRDFVVHGEESVSVADYQVSGHSLES